jgi:tetratricopeptide (TPR) repeat protein
LKKTKPLLLIALVVFAAYAPALRDGFVWDDQALVLRDPLIRSWRLIPEGFQHFLFTDATPSDFYRPMQRLTYTLEYCAVSFRPAVFHFTSIFCHLAATFAFYFFAIELLRLLNANKKWRDRVALIATILWAVHPINSSAVIYVSGRADPLAAAFGFAGLYCALRSLRTNQTSRALLIVMATAAFMLSALSKEIGLIYPVLWLVIVLIGATWDARRNATGVLIFVSVVYFSLRLPAEHVALPQSNAPLPLLVRPILVARAVAEYAGVLIFPRNLYMDRDVETHPAGFARSSVTEVSWRELQTLAGLLLIGGAIYAIVRFRKDNAILVCEILTLLSYLPVSGIFALNATVAEHWLYLPSAFLFLTLCLIIHGFLEKRQNVSNMFVPAASLCVTLLAARTFARTFDWKDQRTFLERNVSHGGDSSRMLTNLGGLETAEGNLAAAQKHLQLALQKDPDQPFALINLAAVAIKQGDYKTAHDTLKRAQQSPLVEAKAHELLAVLENKETGNANLLRMRLASRTGPPDWAIEKRYIKVLDEVGYPERAIGELKLCLGAQWYRAESWEMLSELLAKTGQSDAAARAHSIAQDFDVHL